MGARTRERQLMILDLKCRPYRDDPPLSFRVELQHHALEHLMADAIEAYRVYELMMIRRPGDVWKYLWVKVVEVPPSVSQRMVWEREKRFPYGRCPWPENSLPLNVFDSFFYWCYDDTPPESACWLPERESHRFLEFGARLFERVQAAQKELQSSDDLLVQTEISAIAALRHCHDCEAEVPWEITTPEYQSPSIAKRTTAYYEKLRQLLARPEMLNVAARGDDDYQTLRTVCTEQRRRSLATGNPVGQDMPVHVISDGFPSFSRWGAKVVCWQEGLGYGDLFINEPRSYGVAFKAMF